MRYINEKNVAKEVAKFLFLSPPTLVEKKLDIIIKNTKVKKGLNSGARELVNFGKYKIITGKDNCKLLNLFFSSFRTYSKEIVFFLEKSKIFEQYFLSGDYGNAIEILDLIENEIGDSFWLIRNRLLCLSRTGSAEDYQLYCDQLTADSNTSELRLLINYMIYLSSTSNKRGMLKNVVYRTIKELENAGFSDFPRFIELVLVPYIERKVSFDFEALLDLQLLPIVDQYDLLITEFPIFLEKCKDKEERLKVTFLNEINRTVEFVPDFRFDNLLTNFDRRTHTKNNKLSNSLLNSYERGDYNYIIQKLIVVDNLPDNVGHCINLISKSMAYTNQKLDSNVSVFFDAINLFVKIHLLEGDLLKNIDDIETIVIETYGLTFSKELQLSLLITIPYLKGFLVTKEKINSLSVDVKRASPLIKSLLKSSQGAYDNGIVSFSSSVTLNRKIKNGIAK